MAWEDRDYNQQGSSAGGPRMGGALGALMFGSLSLGSIFRIRIRLHAWFIVFAVLTILMPPRGSTVVDAAIGMGVLFLIVFLHELGHCFAARAVGGEAIEIMLVPFGGLATTRTPERPLPRFLTTAGGPAVNVLICLIAAVAVYVLERRLPSLNPLHPGFGGFALTQASYYLRWIFYLSYLLLLFNLLPLFPLDGGRMLQEALWAKLGFFRSMWVAATVGMFGAPVLAVVGLLSEGGLGLTFWIALMCWLNCHQQRRMLRELGPDGYAAMTGGDGVDYSAAYEHPDSPRRKHLSKRFIKRARKRAMVEQQEQARIDAILDKVSAHGMHSLSWWEKRVLRKATERQRERELEANARNGR